MQFLIALVYSLVKQFTVYRIPKVMRYKVYLIIWLVHGGGSTAYKYLSTGQ